MADAAYKMFGIDVDRDVDAEWTNQEVGPTRLVRDEEDLCKIMAEFQRLGVFTDTEEHVEDLVCLATKDVVPDSIKEDVLKARERGTTLVEEFVTTRLIEKSTDFYATLARKKTPSISRMYKVKVKSKGAEKQNRLLASYTSSRPWGGQVAKKDIKADRNLIQRLFVAAQSGRDIDLNAILSHELSKVPRSLASTNGKLHTSEKAQLQKLLVGEVDIFKSLPKSEAKTCLLIDGAALIQAIGKPAKAQTFEDLSVEFCNSVQRFRPVYSRVDLLFDRYQDLSIKSGTRSKRSEAGKVKPIRRVISSKDVKLPSNFKSFLSLSENKADLTAFLSEAMVEMAEEKLNPTHELVVAGGFEDLLKVWISTDRSTDHLSSNHEEADTRLILHAADASQQGYERGVLQCRDTDVLVLAVAHRDSLPSETWFSMGLKAKRPFIPIHSISLPDEQIQTLIAFHSLTGCDSVSQFADIGKKTAWKVFMQVGACLRKLGSAKIDDRIIKDVERFVCKLYLKDTSMTSINEVRKEIFLKRSLDALPPTKDALEFHIHRANYQSLVWHQCLEAVQQLPNPTSCGWMIDDESGDLIPKLMSLSPLPNAYTQGAKSSIVVGTNEELGEKLSSYNRFNLCYAAVGSMALAGTALGAFGHGWYMLLERRLPGTQFKTIVKKLAAELAMGIPLGTGFIMSISLMEGLSVNKSLQEVKEKFPIMYLVECALWPPIQFVNFYFLHPRYRVLYVSFVMLFWDIFLSYIIHKTIETAVENDFKDHVDKYLSPYMGADPSPSAN
ncbi:Mpv17-like protein 2 [Nymphon striatum]|nr:Mpv17-like protein 2 [Nymphon striatum]